MLDIETVGAGGGSVAWTDVAGVLHVGPSSAGADPGPASYGRGGPFTVTDANLLLGRIPEELLAGDLKLDREASRRAVAGIADRIGRSVEEAAWGVLRVAASNIARALRKVSMERGYDPRRFLLVAFGGAGPQLAAEVGDDVGISQILIPPFPGVLAAQGLLVAESRRDQIKAVLLPLEEVEGQLEEMTRQLSEDVLDEFPSVAGVKQEPLVDLRYEGQSYGLSLPYGPALSERFHEAYRNRYGHAHDNRRIEVVAVRLVVRLAAPDDVVIRPPGTASPSVGTTPVVGVRDVYFQKDSSSRLESFRTTIYNRHQCPLGQVVEGPAILEQYDSTVVVPPNWMSTVLADGSSLITKI